MKKMFCIVGQTCSGKDTFCQLITKEYPQIKRLVYYTTRPMRDGEKDGVDYYFCNDSELDLNKIGVIECRKYEANLGENGRKIIVTYGTKLDTQFENDYLIVPCAMEQLKEYIGFFDPSKLVVIYLNPPIDVLVDRARLRGDDLNEVIDRLDRDRHWYSSETINSIKSKLSSGSYLELNKDILLYHKIDMRNFIESQL